MTREAKHDFTIYPTHVRCIYCRHEIRMWPGTWKAITLNMWRYECPECHEILRARHYTGQNDHQLYVLWSAWHYIHDAIHLLNVKMPRRPTQLMDILDDIHMAIYQLRHFEAHDESD